MVCLCFVDLLLLEGLYSQSEISACVQVARVFRQFRGRGCTTVVIFLEVVFFFCVGGIAYVGLYTL